MKKPLDRIYKKLKKIKKAVLFTKRLGIFYIVHLGYIYFVLPPLMSALPLCAMIYRRWRSVWQKLNVNREISYWRLRKKEILRIGKRGYRKHINEFGLNKEGLKEVKKLLRHQPQVVIADIDQDGLLYSYFGPIKDIPTVSKKRFLKKKRFALKMIVFHDTVAIKKEFCGNKISFVNELSALHHLAITGCNIPAILDIDFNKLSIIKSYIVGWNLQEKLAQKGAFVRDYDVERDPKMKILSPRQESIKYIEEGKRFLLKVVDSQFIDNLFVELKKIHIAGFEVYDIKYRDVIVERESNKPFLVDFSSARDYRKCNRQIFRITCDRDTEKFNLAFDTKKLTYKRIQKMIKNKKVPHIDDFYSPVYFGYGLRIGKIWNVNAGYGRWYFILKDSLPSFSGKRILSLGVNNAFNEIQMLRNGAKEVIGVEIDSKNISQGNFIKESFEWADNNSYNFKYLQADMADIPTMNLGKFDMVLALCSLYYLDDNAITKLVNYISKITDTFVLQCNIRKDIGRDNLHSYEKASVDYAINTLKGSCFVETRKITPPGYSRPLVIGQK